MRAGIEAGTDCDAIVSAAGVSVGEHDHLKAVLEDLGFERRFWRVRMRPGSAALFGLLNGRPFWGVPGNPVSAMVTFEALVRPAIRGMAGFSRVLRRRIGCELVEPVRSPADVLSFLRVVLADRATDPPRVRTTGPQGSGVLTSMRADGLLIVPEGTAVLEAGDRADVLPIRVWHDPPA